MTDGWIQKAIEELALTLEGKNEDYRIDGEFSNFEYAAEVAGVPVEYVLLAQIGIKLGRLKGLGEKKFVNNESVLDSHKDLAGYAVIAYAYLMSKEAPSA